MLIVEPTPSSPVAPALSASPSVSSLPVLKRASIIPHPALKEDFEALELGCPGLRQAVQV